MKKICTGLLLSAALLCAGLAAAKSPKTETSAAGTQERLARVDREIAERSLELNRLIWDHYLEYAERARLTPSVMDFPGMSFNAIRDSVPEIARLQRRYLEADSLYTEVLRTDPEYDSIHTEYIRVRDLSENDARRRPNRERYQQMYARLRRDNPAYIRAYDARTEAMRVRNMALVRTLLEYYRQQGRPMPTSTMLQRYSSPMSNLRSEWPEIVQREKEVAILEKLRGELFEQVQREQLGIPGTTGTPEIRKL